MRAAGARMGRAIPPAVGNIVADGVRIMALGIAAGQHLVAGIFAAGDLRELMKELIVPVGFVQRGLPENGTGMISVAPDRVREILDDVVLETVGIGEMLPARDAHDDHQAEFVAGIEKGRGLRIMRKPDEVPPASFNLTASRYCAASESALPR